jgi:hypothetical protein
MFKILQWNAHLLKTKEKKVFSSHRVIKDHWCTYRAAPISISLVIGIVAASLVPGGDDDWKEGTKVNKARKVIR